MKELKACLVLISIFLLSLNMFLFFMLYDISRKLDDFKNYQEFVKEKEHETNKRQDQDLRLFKQDIDVFWNILLHKDYIKEQKK